MHINFYRRAMLVKRLVDEYYRPESHLGCMRDIYRKRVVRVYPMSESTFYRYMRFATGIDGYIGNGNNRVDVCKKNDRMSVPPVQLSLF